MVKKNDSKGFQSGLTPPLLLKAEIRTAAAHCEAARHAVNGIARRMRLAEDRLTGSKTVPGRRRGLPGTVSGKGNLNVGQVERISIGCGETLRHALQHHVSIGKLPHAPMQELR